MFKDVRWVGFLPPFQSMLNAHFHFTVDSTLLKEEQITTIERFIA